MNVRRAGIEPNLPYDLGCTGEISQCYDSIDYSFEYQQEFVPASGSSGLYLLRGLGNMMERPLRHWEGGGNNVHQGSRN